MENKKKKGSFLIITGLLLLAVALSLVIYNIWDDSRAADSSSFVLHSLNESIPSNNSYAQSELNNGDVPDYIKYPDMEMPTAEIDGHLYIGVLTIPSINIELPVMSDWSYENLKTSPCRYSGSVYNDTLVIAAHNYKAHFGKLKTLRVDDEVYFTDVNGNIFKYRVADLETLSPTSVDEMLSGDCDLTLFTCTLGGQNRITIRCVKQ